MSVTLGIDNNFDLVMQSNGLLLTLRGDESIAQCCTTAMSSPRGEQILDTTAGMPYDTTTFDRFSKKLFEAAARRVILSVPEVASVPAISAAKIDGAVTYSATVSTTSATTVNMEI